MIRDTNLKKTKALNAAAGTIYSDSIDLIDSAPGIKLRNAQIEVAMPATPSLADTKTIIATIQDSADNSSFADVASLNPLTVTGASGAGAAAVTRKYKAPEDLRRYVRVKFVEASAGGDNSGVSATFSVIY